MSANRAAIEQLRDRIESSKIPAIHHGISLLPVSHQEFQARWSLSEELLEEGRTVASHADEEAQLVLRAYRLPQNGHHTDFSSDWQDYPITGAENSAYFTLPTPTEKINAAVGLINTSGRFSPLARGESVCLPYAPRPRQAPVGVEDTKPSEAEASEGAPVPGQCEVSLPALDEDAIRKRLEHIDGLPESFKEKYSSSQHGPAAPSLQPVQDAALAPAENNLNGCLRSKDDAGNLDEESILEIVRRKMAVEPSPVMDASSEQPKLDAAVSHAASPAAVDKLLVAGASEQLASQWEVLWSEKAPIEIRAVFFLSGKIAPQMKLLLGHEILSPTPGGFLSWKRNLNSFHQIWPLLEAALSCPCVAAGPVLEFFRGVKPAERLLELHAGLEIEGRITDPAYGDKLPSGLQLDPDGQFKLSRMLPDGAVILPGISLIASGN